MSLVATHLIGFGGSAGAAASGPVPAWDSSKKAGFFSLSLSDYRATSSASESSGSILALTGKSTGLWYVEYLASNAGSGIQFGIGLSTISTSSTNQSGSYLWNVSSGGTTAGTSGVGTAGTWSTSTDVLQVAFDATNGQLWFGVNNTYTGSPSAGTGASLTGISAGTYYMMGALNYDAGGNVLEIQSTQTYSPPTGFSQWD